MGISKLDTVKDKEGKRFRIADVHTVDGQIVAVLKGIHTDGSPRRGGARQVRADVLEAEYTRVDLSPVTIRKIDDLSEEDKPVVKEPTPSEKAAQIEKEAVRALSEEEVEEALTASTFGPRKPEGDKPKAHTLEVTFEEFRKKNEEDIEILKAELKDRVRENIDLKKTISKMQQQHEAEVQDLKDQLGEAQAEANAIRKRKDEIIKKHVEYADALDDDSIAFEAILDLAHIAQSMSQSLYKVSKRIEAETEGRI